MGLTPKDIVAICGLVIMVAIFLWGFGVLRWPSRLYRHFSYIEPGRRIGGANSCPFCDNPDLVFDVGPDEKYHVACETCGIWGPAGADEPKALAIWNLRA